MSADDRPGPIPRFAIQRQVQERLQIAGLNLLINVDSDEQSNDSEEGSSSDESDGDEVMGDAAVDEVMGGAGRDEIIGDNVEGEENNGMGMVNRDRYEEVPLPEQELNLNNEDNRADYVLNELQKWAMYGVSCKKIDEFLSMLIPLHPNLPKSYKTLLGTPRQNVIYEAAGGEMWYKGIRINIEQRVSPEYLTGKNEIIIDISMDGLPPFKYSYKDCWPTLGRLKGQEEPFVIAVYMGECKPNNVNEYLEDMVNELSVLQVNGIDLHGLVYPFHVRTTSVMLLPGPW